MLRISQALNDLREIRRPRRCASWENIVVALLRTPDQSGSAPCCLLMTIIPWPPIMTRSRHEQR